MFNRKGLVYFLLSLLFLSLIIDFSVGFRTAVSGPVEAGTGWLEGWQYRKSHVINPASGAGTNYPIKIVVHYGSGTDSGENVYLNSHCRADFGDIRFTASDGETLLDYWIEEKVDSDYAVFWVEIADSLSSSSVTIYIYYGKSDATTTSDGLGLDLWQLREYDYSSGAYPKIFFKKPGSSILRIESPGEGPIYSRGYAFIHAKKSYLHGKKLKVRWRAYQSGYDYEYVGFVYIVDHAHFRKKTTDEFKDNDNKEHPITDYTRFCALSIKAPGGWSSWKTSTSSTLDLSSFSSDYVTILIRLKDSWYDVSSKLEIDYLQILDSSDNPLKTFHFTYSVVMEQTGTYRDYGLYRKFVDPEPSHGGWGNEEQPNQPPNPPTLNSPQANERFDPTTSVTFAWTFNDPDAGDSQSAYRFQLDDDSDFSSPIIDTGKVSSSTSSTTQTLPDSVGLYYWRVKTWDSQDAEGDWSSSRGIIVDRVNVALNGLVGYWKFDEGSGDMAGDSSGLINNGTIYNATWVNGKYGKALSFDGVGYVEVPYHPSLDPPSITFLAWIKIKEWRTTTPYHEPIVKQGDSSNNFGFAVNHRGALNKKLYLVSASGGTNPGDFSAGTVEANRWYLVGFIWEDLTASTSCQKLILNGEVIASREIDVPKPSIPTNIYIGRGIVFWEDNKFNGFIDEVRIYNRALSPEEIKALYIRGVDRVVEVGSSQNLQIDAYYEYDAESFSGSITLNDTLTKNTVGKYCFKVVSITDDNYGLTAFTTGETTIIWDKIKIISGGVVNFTIDVDVGGKVWYYAVYEYDNSTFDDSCGVLYLNGFEMTWDGEKWVYAFPYSTEGNQMTFHITGVLDNQYGLTEINNQVGDITINWATMTIEIKKG